MEQQTTPARIGLKWGVITGVVYMLYSAILYLTDQYGNQSLGWISFVVSIIFIVLAMRDYRTQNDGFMTYGEGVSIGLFVSVISAIISGIFSYIYTTFIDNTVVQRLMDKMEEQWVEQGLSDEQIEQAKEWTNMFQSPGLTFLFGLLFALIGGLIISLIVAAFLRRNKPFAEFQ